MEEEVATEIEMWHKAERKVVSLVLLRRSEKGASFRKEMAALSDMARRLLLGDDYEVVDDDTDESDQLRLSIYFEDRSLVVNCFNEMWKIRGIFLSETVDDLIELKKEGPKEQSKHKHIVNECIVCYLGKKEATLRIAVMAEEAGWSNSKYHSFDLCYCHELEQPSNSGELFEHVVALRQECEYHIVLWDVMSELAIEIARNKIGHTPLVKLLLKHEATIKLQPAESRKRKNEND